MFSVLLDIQFRDQLAIKLLVAYLGANAVNTVIETHFDSSSQRVVKSLQELDSVMTDITKYSDGRYHDVHCTLP
jgi:hypothetical protein